jgi:hypothetical protein
MFKPASGMIERITRHRRALLYALLLSCAPLAMSCFGYFPMTKAVYHGNRNVYSSVEGNNTQRKLAQSVVMWVFIPIYAGAAVGDMVVFNLIEFWTGARTDVSYNHEANGTVVALTSSQEGREAVLTVSRNGKLIAEQHVVKVGDTAVEMRDAAGQLTGTILQTPAGGTQLTDAQGRIIRTLAAEDLAALSRN